MEAQLSEEVEIEMEFIELYEEDQESDFEPIEGDSLHVYNAKKVYAAEMSANSKAVMAATKQS